MSSRPGRPEGAGEIPACAAPLRVGLTDSLMRSLQPSRALKDKAGRVNGLDWDKEGESLIASADDESVHVYTMSKGDVHRVLHSKKYGVDMIKFVHQGSRVCVCASRTSQDKDYAIRLWDLAENRYIRYYSLEAQICRGNGLSVHPHRDLMLASCVDSKIRLFNLEHDAKLVSIPSHTSRPVAAFDAGFTFACYLGRSKLHLYDCNHYTAGEFRNFDLNNFLSPGEDVTALSFSPDGKSIVLATKNRNLFTIDSFNGQLLQQFSFSNDAHAVVGPCGYPSFTPDGKYIVCGGPDECIYVWNATTGAQLNMLRGHAGLPAHALFNPKKAILASACLNVVLWQPDVLV